MQSRRSRWTAGVEPRFCATHLVRNPLQAPWSPAPPSASGSPAPRRAPGCLPAAPSPSNAEKALARHTTGASRSQARPPARCASPFPSGQPPTASPINSIPDTSASYTASIPLKMGTSYSVSNLGVTPRLGQDCGSRFLTNSLCGHYFVLRLRGNPSPAQRALWLHTSCKMVLRRLGFGIRICGTPPGSGLIASNHLSYLDILFYGATLPCVFVAKVEVRP